MGNVGGIGRPAIIGWSGNHRNLEADRNSTDLGRDFTGKSAPQPSRSRATFRPWRHRMCSGEGRCLWTRSL